MHWLITGTISLFGAITILYDNFCILPDLHFNGKMVKALTFMETNSSKVSVVKTQASLKTNKQKKLMQSERVSSIFCSG